MIASDIHCIAAFSGNGICDLGSLGPAGPAGVESRIGRSVAP